MMSEPMWLYQVPAEDKGRATMMGQYIPLAFPCSAQQTFFILPNINTP